MRRLYDSQPRGTDDDGGELITEVEPDPLDDSQEGD
jgi:hypothetical protein